MKSTYIPIVRREREKDRMFRIYHVVTDRQSKNGSQTITTVTVKVVILPYRAIFSLSLQIHRLFVIPYRTVRYIVVSKKIFVKTSTNTLVILITKK